MTRTDLEVEFLERMLERVNHSYKKCIYPDCSKAVAHRDCDYFVNSGMFITQVKGCEHDQVFYVSTFSYAEEIDGELELGIMWFPVPMRDARVKKLKGVWKKRNRLGGFL